MKVLPKTESSQGHLEIIPRDTNFSAAFQDLCDGLGQWRLWTALGWQEIKLRYRRTVLGPFWVTLTTLLMIVSLGLLWGVLFGMDLSTYFPYLAAGYIVWQTIGFSITESCILFIDAGDIITSRKVPYTVFPLQFTYRHLIIFMHNITVFVGVAFVFPVDFNANILWAFPALALILLNILWVSYAVGMIGARFRDVQPIVTSLVMMLFFMTPVFWKKEMLRDRAFVADFNPMTHYVEILRAPLLGQDPQWLSWFIVLGITALGVMFASFIFCRSRSRIVYWV